MDKSKIIGICPICINVFFKRVIDTQLDVLKVCLDCRLPTQIFEDYVLEVTNTVGSYIVT